MKGLLLILQDSFPFPMCLKVHRPLLQTWQSVKSPGRRAVEAQDDLRIDGAGAAQLTEKYLGQILKLWSITTY